MLEIKNVKKSFGKQEVLKDVSLRVEKGDVIASWVQNVVRQFGLYLSWAHEICVALTLVREDRVGQTSGLPVVPPGALPGI